MKKSPPKPKAKDLLISKGPQLNPITSKESFKKIRAEFGKLSGNVVQSCIHGPSGKTSDSPPTASMLIDSLKAGLPMTELADLRASLDLPMDRLAPMLGISKATLHRRKAAGRLDPAESDRVLRFARLMGKAVEVLETEQNARSWLTSPQYGLVGAVPLEYAETEVGAREVEDLLGRIAYGVYS
jgi:putative toxin-antitoxin system antitoxin component (TIGR02293 family)